MTTDTVKTVMIGSVTWMHGFYHVAVPDVQHWANGRRLAGEDEAAMLNLIVELQAWKLAAFQATLPTGQPTPHDPHEWVRAQGAAVVALLDERNNLLFEVASLRASYTEPSAPNADAPTHESVAAEGMRVIPPHGVPERYVVRVPYMARLNHPVGLYYLARDKGLTATRSEAHVYHGHDCPAVRDGRPIDHVELEAVNE